jgi:hypothetical protein
MITAYSRLVEFFYKIIRKITAFLDTQSIDLVRLSNQIQLIMPQSPPLCNGFRDIIAREKTTNFKRKKHKKLIIYKTENI